MKVIAIMAQSIDGFIAKKPLEFINWSSKEDKRMFTEETKKAGVVVMGLNTFQTLPYPLKDRLNVVLTSKADQFQNQEGLLEFTNLELKSLITQLKKRGFKQVFVIGGGYTFTKFIKEKLLDEIWISIEPILFGEGLSIFGESLQGISCQLLKSKNLNHNTVQLRYKINY